MSDFTPSAVSWFSSSRQLVVAATWHTLTQQICMPRVCAVPHPLPNSKIGYHDIVPAYLTQTHVNTHTYSNIHTHSYSHSKHTVACSHSNWLGKAKQHTVICMGGAMKRLKMGWDCSEQHREETGKMQCCERSLILAVNKTAHTRHYKTNHRSGQHGLRHVRVV
jgi:hypothetical protein